jgi:uncharacterized integral membrane protein
MKIFSYITIFLIFVLGMTFAYLNAETVTFSYYVGQLTLPLSLLLVITFAVGALVGLFVGFLWHLKAKRKYRAKQAQQV